MRVLSSSTLLVLAVLAQPGFPADAHGDPLPEGALARLGSARFRLTVVWPSSLALSPDGKTISAYLFYGGKSRVVLIDAATGKEARSLPIQTAWTNFSFTSDGKELVNPSPQDATVRFYDVVEGKQLRAVKMPIKRIDLMALSGDNSVVAAVEQTYGTAQAKVAICEVKTGKQRALVETIHNYSVGLALSPDGKYLATFGSYSETGKSDPEKRAKIVSTVQLWDTTTEKEFKKVEAGNQVTGVAFSPDKKTLALSSYNEVQLWDFAQGKRLARWRVSSVGVQAAMHFSADGKRIAVFGKSPETHTVAIWDLEKERRVSTARQPDCTPVSVHFGKDRIVALGYRGNALVLWDVITGKRLDVDEGHGTPVTAAVVHSKQVYTVSADGKLLTWDLSGKFLKALPELRGSVRSRTSWSSARDAFSLDAMLLATDHDNNLLRVREVGTGEELFSYPRSSDNVPPQFSTDGKLLALTYPEFGKKKRYVRVVRCASGQELLRFDSETSQPRGLAIDPSGKRLAIVLTELDGQKSSTVRVWHIDTGKQDDAFTKFEIPGWGGPTALAYSADGTLLSVVGAQQMYLRDGVTGKDRGTIKFGESLQCPPAFAPDGLSLAVATFGTYGASNFTVWDVQKSNKRWEAKSPVSTTTLALDQSGVLVTAHADTTVLLWKLPMR